ncbi:glycosyltransferase [Komagataeibacter europaeus]|uniref:glycosyltransferase n=1 Tax=Komagataeibacter europaeus TaxID=33995 RepID=UPI001E6261A6|nr:glycosyltransferase [Komagataeibacter europaeus]
MNSQSPSLPRLAIVVPCYNESEVFSYCLTELGGYLGRMISDGMISPASYLLFVDDGSRDDTWRQISAATKSHAHVRGLKLSCNTTGYHL